MDNERPIEKLLRRYAKKRRDDPAAAGLKIHPATRRMLQGEVARQFKEVRGARDQVSGSSPDPSHLTPRALTNLWPRLVWALPVLVVLGVGVWTIVQSRKSPEGIGNLAKTESPSPAQLRESQSRTETPAQSVGGVTPSNVAGPVTLAYSDGSRTKDSISTFGVQEEKLKADRAPASAVNTPAPSLAVPAPEVAKLDKAVQEESIAGRAASERFARDARADRPRDLSLSARQTRAQEPATSATEKVEATRTLPAATTEDLGVARKVGSRPGTTGTQLAGGSERATPPPAAPSPLSLSTKSVLTKVERDRAQAAPETVVQKFVQTTAVLTSGNRAKQSAETPSVLETFQLEQTGNQLRVIDSDGSSYNGSIQFATTDAVYDAAGETKKTADFKNPTFYRQAVGQKGLEAQAGQNYFFSVAGTNRTLNQPVAFTGNLLMFTNALPAAETGLTFSPTTKSQFPKGQADLPTLQNSSISGKVQLGRDQEMRINAVPVAR